MVNMNYERPLSLKGTNINNATSVNLIITAVYLWFNLFKVCLSFLVVIN